MAHSLIRDSISKSFKSFNANYFLLLSQTNSLIESLDYIKNNTNPENISVEESLHFLFLKNQIDRNTRILKTYKYKRCKKIEQAVIKKIQLENANEEDKNYKGEFEDIYNTYLSDLGMRLDCEIPLDFFVTVVPLKECGCILINNEVVELEIDKMYFVKRKSIKHLIESGRMKIID